MKDYLKRRPIYSKCRTLLSEMQDPDKVLDIVLCQVQRHAQSKWGHVWLTSRPSGSDSSVFSHSDLLQGLNIQKDEELELDIVSHNFILHHRRWNFLAANVYLVKLHLAKLFLANFIWRNFIWRTLFGKTLLSMDWLCQSFPCFSPGSPLATPIAFLAKHKRGEILYRTFICHKFGELGSHIDHLQNKTHQKLEFMFLCPRKRTFNVEFETIWSLKSYIIKKICGDNSKGSY